MNAMVVDCLYAPIGDARHVPPRPSQTATPGMSQGHAGKRQSRHRDLRARHRLRGEQDPEPPPERDAEWKASDDADGNR